MRLAPYSLAILLLAIRAKDDPPRDFSLVLAVIASALAFGKFAVTTASLAIGGDRQEKQLAALEHVERGAPLVFLVGQPCTNTWPLFRPSHLGAMAIVRRHAFSNEQWSVEGANLLKVRFPEAGWFRADPSQMVSSATCLERRSPPVDQIMRLIPRDAFDYVWVVDVPPFDPKSLAGYHLVWSSDGSSLFAKDRLRGKDKA